MSIAPTQSNIKYKKAKKNPHTNAKDFILFIWLYLVSPTSGGNFILIGFDFSTAGIGIGQSFRYFCPFFVIARPPVPISMR